MHALQRQESIRTQGTRGMEGVPQSGLTFENTGIETPSTSHSSLSSPKNTKRARRVQRLSSTSSDDEENCELWNQSVQQPNSPQHSHELCDIQRGYEFIDLTNQIPTHHNNIFETHGDDDTVEWNEDDELGQTDEDQTTVITLNLVMWS